MPNNYVLFNGLDASGNYNLWVTDGTPDGTSELSVVGANPGGLDPNSLIALGSEALFAGTDANGNEGLWVTDGTSGGTSEIESDFAGFSPNGFAVLGNELLFASPDAAGNGALWVTNGTSGGTTELSVPNANSGGLDPDGLTTVGSDVFFVGQDSNGSFNLWVTDGTLNGTSELPIVQPTDLTAFGNEALFAGQDNGLWVTDRTANGTSELANPGTFGLSPSEITVFGNEAVFSGLDASGNPQLWETNGTPSGTSEVFVSGADPVQGLTPENFTAFGNKVLFDGNTANEQTGLWVTDGTSSGTSELVAGVKATDITVIGNKAAFVGVDGTGNSELWVTDGTVGGTSELSIEGASSNFNPSDLVALGNEVLFAGVDANNNDNLWVTDGTASGTSELSGSQGALGPSSLTSVDAAPCYCRGTLILTDRGDVPIEELKIGDSVMTVAGAARPIKWIGRRFYSGRFVMGRKDVLPMCVKAGALDENVPRRDLWISPHHAMYLDGVLIEAKDLVNGVSIVQAERVEHVEYFHIELESHDVIIAEGALSESFIDDDSRGMFQNAHEYGASYPSAPSGLIRYCAPRPDDGYVVEAARRKIELRAGLGQRDQFEVGMLRGHIDEAGERRITGWVQNVTHPEAPVCLDIFADGHLIGRVLANRYRADLKRAGLGSGFHSFEFAPPAGLAINIIEIRRRFDGAVLGSSIQRQRHLKAQPR